MKKKILLIIIVIIIVFIIVKKLIPDERNYVIKDIKMLKKAVEEEDKRGVLKYVDEDYNDKNEMIYEELINIIDDFFMRVDSIKIVTSGMKIKIDSTDDKNNVFASCSLGLKVFAKYEGIKVLYYGGVIKPGRVRVYLKKAEDHYKVYYAKY